MLGFTLPCAALAAYIGSPWRWFSWHPLLMMLAFVAAAGSGILTKHKGGRENTIMHGYCMIFALLLSLGGWYVIYQYVRRQLHTFPPSQTHTARARGHVIHQYVQRLLHTFPPSQAHARTHPPFGIHPALEGHLRAAVVTHRCVQAEDHAR